MALFYKRPLAAGCFLLIAAAVAALLLPLVAVVVLAVAAGLCLAVTLLLFLRRRSAYRRLWLLILALSAVLGLSRVLAQRLYTDATVGDALDTESTAVVTVREIGTHTLFGSQLLVSLEELNGKSCSLTALMSAEGLTPFGLGDRIGGSFWVVSVDSEAIDSETRTNLLADGICAILYPTDANSLILLESGNGSLLAAIDDLRYGLHHRLTTAVEGEAGDLLGALLLGTRNDLDAETVRDFRRTGLSHLLALSGLHLAILVQILEWVLKRLRVGKRGITGVLIVFCLLYLALTGFSFSMLRAVIMLVLLRGSFLFGADHDAFTALSLGGALIVAATPGAVFSLSFQLTMLATFGILAFGSLQNRLLRYFPARKGLRGAVNRALRFVISSVLVTLSATLAVLPVQWLVFGQLPLISVLANLPTALLMLPLLTLGMLLLPIVLLKLPALPLALPTKWSAQMMLWLIARLSRTDTVLSLRYSFVPFIFIPLFALTALLLVVRLKKHLQPLVVLPALLAILAFSVALPIAHAVGEGELNVIYRTTGSNDALLLQQNDKAVLCDLSSGSLTQLHDSYALLEQAGACELDVLILTHYHKDQRTALSGFCRAFMVRALWLPEPESEADKATLADILSMAIEEELPVTVYKRGAPLAVFGTGELTVSPALTDERSVEPAFSVSLSFGTAAVRYETASYAEYAAAQGIARESDCTHLILGGHGPRPHVTVPVPDWQGLREVLVSSDSLALHLEPRDGLHYVICPFAWSLVME